MECISVLKELSVHTAVSGYEKSMADYIKESFGKDCDSVEEDRFYNVIGIKKGNKSNKKIMITAHYDEIGFLVSGIDEKGFLRFTSVGGIDPKILLAQEVIVHGRSDLLGIIGAKPPHLLKPEEAKKAVKMGELRIDMGMTPEKVREQVSIGDLITFKAVPFELQGKKLSSKTLDNRCGVTSLIEILKELRPFKFDSDIYVVATTQEEVGLTGVEIASYNLQPDIAIVIDACHGDIPDAPKGEAYALGKGPAVAIGPNLHPKLTKKVIEIAKSENIPYQIDIERGDTGTEAWATQVSRSGIPTILLSIPVRYMHTTVETVHANDIENTAKLAARFIVKAETEMEELLCF
ncbi:MAG: M42 family metallopeptidase [Clostridia bacterium]|nr:M42 family metallopeptidase [Clostridia bacterium]